MIDLDTTEVLLVDDGSTDGTAQVAAELLADLKHGAVLRLLENAGKGAAIRLGVSRARGTATVFMDADMAADPRDVHRLLDRLDRAHVVVGSRAAPGGLVEGAPLTRALMGRTFNRFLRFVTGLALRDTQCGFKAFRTSAAKLLFALSEIDGFAFDVEILLLAGRIGMVVEEVPVRWRHQAGSHVSPVRDSVTMLSDVVRLRRAGWSRAIPALAVRASADHRRSTSAMGVVFETVRVSDLVLATGARALVLLPLATQELAVGMAERLAGELIGFDVHPTWLGLKDLAGMASAFGPRQFGAGAEPGIVDWPSSWLMPA